MTAAEELLKHVGDRAVKYVQVFHEIDWDTTETIEGTLEQVLPHLNFDYDGGYSHQYIFGTIWHNDGSWSERDEYDGNEWWVHRACPPLPEGALEKPKTPHIEKCEGCGNDVNVDNGLVVSQGGYGVTVHNSICDYVYGRRGWRQLGAYDG
jgi:hypothetical protein